MAEDTRYRLTLMMVQDTPDGNVEPDGDFIVNERSKDQAVHMLKCKVFTKHIAKAVSDATEELVDMGLAAMPSVKGKK